MRCRSLDYAVQGAGRRAEKRDRRYAGRSHQENEALSVAVGDAAAKRQDPEPHIVDGSRTSSSDLTSRSWKIPRAGSLAPGTVFPNVLAALQRIVGRNPPPAT